MEEKNVSEKEKTKQDKLQELLKEETFEEILNIKNITQRAIKEEDLFEKAKKIGKMGIVKQTYFNYKKEQAKKNNQMAFDDGTTLNIPRLFHKRFQPNSGF